MILATMFEAAERDAQSNQFDFRWAKGETDIPDTPPSGPGHDKARAFPSPKHTLDFAVASQKAGARLVSQPPMPKGFVVVFSVGDAAAYASIKPIASH